MKGKTFRDSKALADYMGYSPYMNTHWSQILAEAVLRVAESLGVNVEVSLGMKDECIFITIEGMGGNLNINGLDIHEGMTLNYDVWFSTLIGFRNYWYNQTLFPQLVANPDFVNALEKIYDPCDYNRKIRIRERQLQVNVDGGQYASISDYLNAATATGIWRNSISKADCISEVQQLGQSNNAEALGKLNRYNVPEWTWLEILEIKTKPHFILKDLLAKKPATIAELERQLECHFRGMYLIEAIFCAKNFRDIARIRNSLQDCISAYPLP